MRPAFRFFILLVAVFSSAAWAGKTIEVMTGMDDVFLISETDQWNVRLERELKLRFADVRIAEKHGYPFSVMLYFKADTPDLAQFDTPQKMERSVRLSSEKYLPGIVEKAIMIQKVPVLGTYGFYTVLTDADVARNPNPGPREFKYLTRGMVRLSKNSALGFSIMSNDVDSADYRKLLDYVFSFVKAGAKN